VKSVAVALWLKRPAIAKNTSKIPQRVGTALPVSCVWVGGFMTKSEETAGFAMCVEEAGSLVFQYGRDLDVVRFRIVSV